MRTPEMGLSQVLPRSGILLHKFAPASISLRGRALLQRFDFGVELSGSRQKFEELISQIRFLEPVLPQNRLPGGLVVGFGSQVSRKQIADKNRIVRKSPVGIQVQAKIHLGTAADERLKILFQLAALEDPDGILSQFFELRGPFLPQIKACQLVIPRAVWKSRHRAAVDLPLLHTEAVLVHKNRQPLAPPRILGGGVQLSPKHRTT